MKTFSIKAGLLCLGAALLINSGDAFAWGQKGHDITCDIARKHLTKKAQKEIDRIFEGKSIVYWANWMDNASHTDEFAYTKTWHYKNIDADETYESVAPAETGDVVTAIDAQIAALKSKQLNKEAEAIALRFLVHLVGDLHCPMHMGHKSDTGGNKVQIRFFNEGRNLHSLWDTPLVDSAHKWTYSEWTREIDTVTKAEIAAIQEGTPYTWGKETAILAGKIYEGTPTGVNLSYDYVTEWTPVAEQQLLKGGLRLAKILNEIFK